MKKLNLFFMFAFILSTLVQFNDPDPLRWIILYSAISIVCVLYHLEKLPLLLSAALMLVCLGWMLTLVPALTNGVPWSEIADSLVMQSDAVEEARELGGLLLVLVWSTSLFVTQIRKSKKGATTVNG